ncbi:MAG: amidase [Pseudomonadota bacterium]
MSELAFKSAIELAKDIKNKNISASELFEHYLSRIEQYNEGINAIILMDAEAGRAQAKAADEAMAKGESLGPLHGVPMTVKESYNLTGMPTTWGLPHMKNNIAKNDALSVQRLKDAGVNIFGKTNVPVMLSDFQSYNPVYGTTNNPWDHGRTPGGSSGGSAAALAAGLTGIETGSDIGGSIRNPAHYCGVFGHKPTWGLLPMRGHALAEVITPTDISVIGPLARSAADLELAVQIMAGPDRLEAAAVSVNLPTPSQKSLGDYKIALWKDDVMCPVSREVVSRIEQIGQIVEEAGGQVDEFARPDFTSEYSHDVYFNLLHAAMAARQPDDAYHEAQERVRKAPSSDNSELMRTLRAQTLTHRSWGQYNEARNQMRWAWRDLFDQYDLVLAPIMPTAAFPHDQNPQLSQRTIDIDGEQVPYFNQVFWAGLTGVVYLPSTVIPTGLNGDNLPIGIQVIGPEYGDMQTIGFAKLLEGVGFKFTAPANYQ